MVSQLGAVASETVLLVMSLFELSDYEIQLSAILTRGPKPSRTSKHWLAKLWRNQAAILLASRAQATQIFGLDQPFPFANLSIPFRNLRRSPSFRCVKEPRNGQLRTSPVDPLFHADSHPLQGHGPGRGQQRTFHGSFER